MIMSRYLGSIDNQSSKLTEHKTSKGFLGTKCCALKFERESGGVETGDRGIAA